MKRAVQSALRLLAWTSLFFPLNAKILPRRDPLDGALDATAIVIVSRQVGQTFRVEETFLGDATVGDSLSLPGFELKVADETSFIAGVERIEPIQPNKRILVFLKPAGSGWAVAGAGNCYFWSDDPNKLNSLRQMAKEALDLRAAWNAARNLPNERERVKALWPFLWGYRGSCYHQTLPILHEIGPVAGEFIAAKLPGLDRNAKERMLWDAPAYHSEILHQIVIRELHSQMAKWDDASRRTGWVHYDQSDPPGRIHYSVPRPEDADADNASAIYGALYQGFGALAHIADRKDLPCIREAAAWGIQRRFKQLDDAALEAFRAMPEKENLPLIEAIWGEYSRRPFEGNALQPYDVMKTLNAHRYQEAIPMMAQFVSVGFAQDMARRFLVEMTGENFGGDTAAWLSWVQLTPAAESVTRSAPRLFYIDNLRWAGGTAGAATRQILRGFELCGPKDVGARTDANDPRLVLPEKLGKLIKASRVAGFA